MKIPHRLRAPRHGRPSSRGQALVIMVMAMVASLTMVAAIVDGGNAWSQQRISQNSADSAANAGATVLGERLAGQTKTSSAWDAAVYSAVLSNWNANITHSPNSVAGYYTDICGTLLTSAGAKATSTATAAHVGGGSLPSEPNNISPDCTSVGATPGPVAGVQAVGGQTFPTYVAGIVNIHTFKASATATAVSGFLQGCSTDNNQNCVVLPIGFPGTLTSCDNSGKAVVTGSGWTYGARVVLPICKYNGGNFGWLDWSPPNGGVSELIYCLNNPTDETTCFPTSTAIPVWLEAAEQGNPSSSTLESAINQWAYATTGQTVLIPFWDEVCGTLPPSGGTCPSQTLTSATGNQNYYHISKFGVFELEAAYTTGNNSAICNPPWSPDGNSNDCLIGVFESFITEGTVFRSGSSGAFGGAVGVQLIK
jgi:hypothetical protein